MPLPNAVVMCAPDHFAVIDVKNPFMADQLGKVDSKAARNNWDEVKAAFEKIGVKVWLIPPQAGREDMVFCANQTFTGVDARGQKVCVLSQMKYPSRQLEVPAFASWFADHGYTVVPLGKPGVTFEGGGDAIWHPGRALIWGGSGPRTQAGAYAALAEHFSAEVLHLELSKQDFYHLDTCFAAIDENTALIYPPAFTGEGLKLIEKMFKRVIEVDDFEARDRFACNAAAFLGKYVVMQKGAKKTKSDLEKAGFEVVEVETNEFLKSGGSVYCMKMVLF